MSFEKGVVLKGSELGYVKILCKHNYDVKNKTYSDKTTLEDQTQLMAIPKASLRRIGYSVYEHTRYIEENTLHRLACVPPAQHGRFLNPLHPAEIAYMLLVKNSYGYSPREWMKKRFGVEACKNFLEEITKYSGLWALYLYVESKILLDPTSATATKKLIDFCKIVNYLTAQNAAGTLTYEGFKAFEATLPDFPTWVSDGEYMQLRKALSEAMSDEEVRKTIASFNPRINSTSKFLILYELTLQQQKLSKEVKSASSSSFFNHPAAAFNTNEILSPEPGDALEESSAQAETLEKFYEYGL